MKYQKALLCIALAGTLIFSGCGSTNNSTDTDNTTSTSSSVESTVEASTEDTDTKSDENTIMGMISEITDSTITVATMPGGGHQHVPEIKQSLKQLQNSFDAEIDFIPYRGDFARGIFATMVVKTKVALEEIVRMYEEYYAKDSFVHIVDKNIDLKQVVNTNKCLIHLEKHGDKLLIISCIDNLLKGASGQAVHNMNLMFNLEETVGLRLKPSAF